jgi:hypothetical protein
MHGSARPTFGRQDLTSQPPPVWARVTADGDPDAGPVPHEWEEVYQTTPGSWAALPGGKSGTTTSNPLYLADGTAAASGAILRAWLYATGSHWVGLPTAAGDLGAFACLEVLTGVTCDPDTNEPVIETRTIHFIGYVADDGCGAGSGSGSAACMAGGAEQPANVVIDGMCAIGDEITLPGAGDCAWGGVPGTSITGGGSGAVFTWAKTGGVWFLSVVEDGVTLATFSFAGDWDGTGVEATFVSGTGDCAWPASVTVTGV